ncbi:MAG: DUF5658 family protein [Acidimicrobiia bacterium]|nr:DUF5658 family protein [Acidimicrobiia bacterium]
MDTTVMDRRTETDRRSRRVSFRYPERRTGFDRRALNTSARMRVLDAYRQRSALIAWCVAAVVGLGVADFVLTLRLIDLGATEINPVMGRLLDGGPVSAAVFKGLMTLAVAGGVWALRRYRRVLELSLAVLVVMAAVVLYEVAGLLIAAG